MNVSLSNWIYRYHPVSISPSYFYFLNYIHTFSSNNNWIPGENFHDRLMSHLENDSNLLETVLSLPRLWRQNFYDSKAGNRGILQRAPSVLVVPLDFGLFGGQTKTKQTDRLRYLEARYMKYFGGISPVTLNMSEQGS